MSTEPTHLSEVLPVWLRAPANLMSEEDIRRSEREMRFESRRERLTSSPILDELGEGDLERILRDRMDEKVHAFHLVKTWVERWTGHAASVTRPVLVLSGRTGSGKTLAAAWALAEVGARYVRFPEVIQDHRSFARKDSMETQERARGAWRTKYGLRGFLILDELGIEEEGDRDDARAALTEVFNIRQKWDQRTLVLTNKSNEELVERFETGQYDGRLRSRITRLLVTAENDENQISINVKGRDLRRAPTPARRA